jgi:membrane protein
MAAMSEAARNYREKVQHKRRALSPWKLGGLTPLQLGKRTINRFNQTDITDRSAALGYYYFLALFPLIILVLSVAGLVLGSKPDVLGQAMNLLGRSMPGDAASVITKTLRDMVQASGGWKIGFGLIGTLWAATGAMSGVGTALNYVYEVPEGRPIYKRYAIYIALTIGVAILGLLAIGIFLFGGTAANYVASHIGMATAGKYAWLILQWPVAIALVVTAFAIVYYFAPDVEQPHWHWITPGSVVGVFIWIVISLLFKLYLTYFNSYSKTYGALAGVIILLTWLYLSGMSLLFGGAINAEIEHAAAERGHPEAKGHGEKEPNENEERAA